MDVFHNKELLIIIQKHHKKLDIQCNVGIATTTLIGELPGYGTVWYNANGIANINKATESLMIAWKEMIFMATNQMELFEIEVENQHENEERQPMTGEIEG